MRRLLSCEFNFDSVCVELKFSDGSLIPGRKLFTEYTELFSGKVYKTQNKKILLPTDECPAQMLVLK